ncbi:Predicted nucleic acid-binding protein, contains PIN domain [Roseateles sp. YR242]|uniref:PIN domain-containing protein n=1 Tax=Roseateles sp. YR242 TaxID=1855305 RepID=UPI0008BCD8D0|nr:PIN domain-containing protein [Roseateles sp. YR242]SEK86023.1 Predicted nucleic acid-binding protein, contains PIN domain [Roseateles sp. YR242]
MSRRTGSGAPARVVLDPALVLRALLCSDEPARLLRRAWQQGVIRPLLSAESAAQLVRALAYPSLKLTVSEREELLADYLPYVDALKLDISTRVSPAGLSPLQAQLLQMGRQGDARWIITGCQALLAWSVRGRRVPRGVREPCTIVDVTSWYRVLTPSQKTQLLC